MTAEDVTQMLSSVAYLTPVLCMCLKKTSKQYDSQVKLCRATPIYCTAAIEADFCSKLRVEIIGLKEENEPFRNYAGTYAAVKNESTNEGLIVRIDLVLLQHFSDFP